jgi:hypothetical protein
MNRTRKIAHPIVRNPAWRSAFERLDKALEQNTQSGNSDYSKKIQQLGSHMFGDLWKPRAEFRPTPITANQPK